MTEESLIWLEKQYKVAIDARDKLNDNFYKWMSYYYLANAGIIVATTTLFSKNTNDSAGIIYLSILGCFTSILWHFSCKGYYYWSNNWIYIIYYLEKQLLAETDFKGVYSLFSKEVHDKRDKILPPNSPANISTPKLTLIFSFAAIICWLLFACYHFLKFYPMEWKWKIALTILSIGCLTYVYLKLLPRYIQSKTTDKHTLV